MFRSILIGLAVSCLSPHTPSCFHANSDSLFRGFGSNVVSLWRGLHPPSPRCTEGPAKDIKRAVREVQKTDRHRGSTPGTLGIRKRKDVVVGVLPEGRTTEFHD